MWSHLFSPRAGLRHAKQASGRAIDGAIFKDMPCPPVPAGLKRAWTLRDIVLIERLLAAPWLLSALLFSTPAAADQAPKMNIPATFSVSSSGAFTYSVPLAAPPGTAGMVPSLSLDYSSQGGTGLEGIGFRLSGLPAITRCPRTIAQDGDNQQATDHGSVNFDSNDHFCMEGQRLVKLTAGASQAVVTACGSGGTPVEYRTEIDGFSRIGSCGEDSSSTGPLYFKVWTKTGQIMDFGNSVDSRLHPVGYDYTSGARSPIGAYSVWGVNKIADVAGNYMLVTYNCAASSNVCTDTDRVQNGQIYPLEITYTGNCNQSTCPLAPYNSVQFIYQARSNGNVPDQVPQFQAGTVQTMTKLLQKVVMCTSITMTCPSGNIVRQYSLTYFWDQYLGLNVCCARINTITECAATTSNCLAPIALGWTGANKLNEQPELDIHTNNTGHGGTSSKPNNFNADFNGDGLTDLAVLAPDGSTCDQLQNAPTPYFATNVYNDTPITGDGWEFSANNPPPSGPFSTVQYGSNQNKYNCVGTVTASFYNLKTNIIDYDGDGYSDIAEQDMTDDNDFWILHNDRSGNFTGTPGAYRSFSGGPWADYNGDGRSDFVYWPTNPDDNHITPYFSQGNDGSGNPVFVSSGVTTGVQNKDKLDAGDFVGDGCADVLWLKQQAGTAAKALTSYCHTAPNNPSTSCNANVTGVNNYFNICAIQDWPLCNCSRQYVLGDFNGDGKTDILVYGGDPATPSNLFVSTGTAFRQISTNVPLPTINKDYIPTTGDFNGDGRTDVAFTPPSSLGTNVLVLLSVPPASGETSDGVDLVSISNPQLQINGTTRGTVAGDWNSDGNDDLWLQASTADTQIIFNYQGPHLLGSVDNGLGVTVRVRYDRINNSASLYTKASDATYPTQDIDGPLYVVSEVDSGNGINPCTVSSTCYASTYSYAGLKADLHGRGLLGFSSVTITDVQTGVHQQTNYYTQFPFSGLISSQTRFICQDSGCVSTVTLDQTQNCYTTSSTCPGYTVAPTALTLPAANGVGDISRYYIQLRETKLTTKDTDGSQFGTTTTDYAYDCDNNTATPCYGLATSVTVTKQHLATDINTKTTTNTYYPLSTGSFLSNWFVDRLQQSVVTIPSTTLARTSSFVYDNNTGLLTDEYVEPNDTGCFYLHTNYQYDAFGNKTQAKASSYNHACGADRTTNSAWDPASPNNGAFATLITNATHTQSEAWSYDNRFGTPTTHQGPNELLSGKKTQWGYDAFGRKTQEIRPDGNQTFYDYGVCPPAQPHPLPPGESCPTTAKFWAYSVSANSTGSLVQGVLQGQNGPYALVFYDGLARVVAADTQTFDGHWARIETDYDAIGRIAQVSRPFCLVAAGSSCQTGSTTPQWTVNCYKTGSQCGGSDDPEGRAQVVTYPDGTYDTYTYAGLTTTVARTDPNQSPTVTHTTKTTLDARRNVVKVIDANNKTTTYAYDSFENLITITAPNAIVTSSSYDTAHAQRKTGMTDPDMGSWTYGYDAFGELTSQIDAKLQTTTILYDVLGRTIQKKAGSFNANWVYDTAANGIGQLAAACVRSDSSNTCVGLAAGDYLRTYSYDTLNRPMGVTLTLDSANYAYALDYNSDGRPYEQTYPSGFKTKNLYTPLLGGLCRIADDTSGASDCTSSVSKVYWTANARDQEGHLTLQTAGNSVQTTQIFYPTTGRIEQIHAQLSTDLANFTYYWDGFGNLTSRQDTFENLSEFYCYDSLNRLTNTGSSLGGGTSCTTGTNKKTIGYDVSGNITKKTDVSINGGYTYGANGAGPHALTAIATCLACSVDGVANPSYLYDADGNMTCELAPGQTVCDPTAARYVAWTPFNKASLIVQGSANTALTYDSEQARYKQVSSPTGSSPTTRYYFNALGAMSEKDTLGIGTTWHDYIRVDGQIVAEHTLFGSQNAMNYFTLDHLGSIAVAADASGAVTSRPSYDAWGRRRNADGTDDPTCSNPSFTDRGFTNQEMLDDECMVNLNARIYDPTIARFLSPDPTVEQFTNLQDLNRYSYVGNNPLSLTDPSGLCFLGCFWNNAIFRSIAAIVAAALAQEWALPELEGLQSGAAISTGTATLNAGISGGLSGFVATGRLNGALYGALEGVAFAGVHVAKADLGIGDGSIGSGLMHGAVGGLFSMASGQGFKSGFLAAGFSDIAGDGGYSQNTAADITAHALYGGIGSVLGGGKFANGAITGAFGYLYNEIATKQQAVLLYVSAATFKVADDAYAAAIAMAEQYANFDSLEYGGTIFSSDPDHWGFTLYKGSPGGDQVNLGPTAFNEDGKTVYAWWHTHLDFGGTADFVYGAANSMNKDGLSHGNVCQGPCDVEITRSIDTNLGHDIGAYLYLPNGTSKFYPDPTKSLDDWRNVGGH